MAGISAHLALPFQAANPASGQVKCWHCITSSFCCAEPPLFRTADSLWPSLYDLPVTQGIVLSAEVQKAMRQGTPIVALESTIISHGMPYPQNLETAQAVEGVVREAGAVPATVAILGGVPHVGLTPQQLNHIASRSAPTVCVIHLHQNSSLEIRAVHLRWSASCGPAAQQDPMQARLRPGVLECSALAVHKTSRRDLPHVIARKLDGATTVSATMLLAARAGIAVFVTGGAPPST